MTDEEIKAIEERAGAATPGPWTDDRSWPAQEWWSVLASDGDLVADMERRGEADAIFIAAARSDVPALCAEVRRLREELDFWRGPHATGGADCGCWKCCAERNSIRAEIAEAEVRRLRSLIDEMDGEAYAQRLRNGGD